MEHFGERLKALRKHKHRSQAEACAEFALHYPEMAMSQSYWSHWERSKKFPKEELLRAFCNIFDVDIDYFVDSRVPLQATRTRQVYNYIESLRDYTPSDPRRFTGARPVVAYEEDDEWLDTD